MGKRFIFCKEDFVCKNCGEKVTGNGYTNHCPVCLWSRHVDTSPGDRKNKCLGLMEPVSIEVKKVGSSFIITHKCLKCGIVKKNRSAKNDSFDAILALSKGGIE